MAQEFSTLLDSFGGLSLAEGTGRPSPYQTLVGAIRVLEQTAEATDTDRRVFRFTEDTGALGDDGDDYLVAYITALASVGTQTEKLLLHFRDGVKSIARDVVNSTSDNNTVLREILEHCYRQSIDVRGTLNCNDYYIPRDEAALQWPYDPDFQSEEYYEHESRLEVDEAYAKNFQRDCERRWENESRREPEWIGFWVQALNKCPHGPTLFDPRRSLLVRVPRLTDVPRYLFRAFDKSSSGLSDGRVVASEESISLSAGERSRVDLLSRPQAEAAKMLHNHLHKPCFGAGEPDDNLMSWSSSLLFVVQYAIWRSRHHARRTTQTPKEVSICAIDTTKFPRGQFARDMELIRIYGETAEADYDMRKFFDFRLNSSEFDNGEFLSQGKVHHAGRSCVISLDQLVQAGLFDLYPELAEGTAGASGKERWTNRVLSLRSGWSTNNHPTTRHDIQTALGLARTCFEAFDVTDVALLLLAFKNRKRKHNTMTETTDSTEERQKDLKHYGPEEVQRYIGIAKRMQGEKGGLGDLNSPLSRLDVTVILEEMFECTPERNFGGSNDLE